MPKSAEIPYGLKRKGAKNEYSYYFRVGGKAYSKSTKRSDFKAAYDVADKEYKRLLNAYQLGIKEDIDLNAAIAMYLKGQKKYKENTYDANVLYCNRITGFKLDTHTRERIDLDSGIEGTTLIHKIDNENIADMQDALHEEGLGLESIRKQIGTLRAILERAKSKGYRNHPNLKWERMDRGESKIAYLEANEEAAFLAVIKERTNQDYMYAVGLLDIGCRCNELATVQFRNIDWDNNTLHIVRGKGNPAGDVPMSQRVRDLLVAESLKREPDLFDYVFLNKAGDSHRTKADDWFKTAMDSTGINIKTKVAVRGRVTRHSLRHTFVTKMLNAGLTLEQIGDFIGHSHTAMTETYGHLCKDKNNKRLIDVINQMNG